MLLQYTEAHYSYVSVAFWYKERARPGDADVHQSGYALLNADMTERPVLGTLRTYLASR